MKKLLLIFVSIISLAPSFLHAQDDLLKMLDDSNKDDKKKDRSLNKVTAMFKDPTIINMQTPQTTGAGALNFNISHRFGNMGGSGNGGVHTLYGWDAISDVRVSLDYGITKNLQIGVGRCKRDEATDASLKWRILEQRLDNKIPFSVCLYTVASFTPKLQSALYAGTDTAWVSTEVAKNLVLKDRFTYTSQIIIARKFAKWLSVAISPSYTHRNYVLTSVNPYNGAEDDNNIYSLGAGIRLKLTRSFSILADYFYVNSKYRLKNPANPYYAPIAVGIEIETGGHVFHLDFTNAPGITANYFIPNSADSWTKGGYKLGFNISRAFPLGKKKGKKDKRTESAEKNFESENTPAAQAPVSETTQKPAEKPIVKTAAENKIYKVTGESLNMRSGAGTNYPLIMKINKGASVEVIEKVNADWWKIKYNDEAGYVSSKFLSK